VLESQKKSFLKWKCVIIQRKNERIFGDQTYFNFRSCTESAYSFEKYPCSDCKTLNLWVISPIVLCTVSTINWEGITSTPTGALLNFKVPLQICFRRQFQSRKICMTLYEWLHTSYLLFVVGSTDVPKLNSNMGSRKRWGGICPGCCHDKYFWCMCSETRWLSGSKHN